MNLIRLIIKKFFPESWKKLLRYIMNYFYFLYNYIYDAERYIKYSTTRDYPKSRTHLRALITMDYHGLEKGLSLESPKGWFGRDLIERLIKNIDTYIQFYGKDELTDIAVDSLFSYYKFNCQYINQSFDGIYKSIIRLMENGRSEYYSCGIGGVKLVDKTQVCNVAKIIDFEEFVKSRHSVRHFSQEPVDINLIKKAVEIAIFTPSVCNRQAWRLCVITEQSLKGISLDLQGGNRGFTEQVSTVLIITCDLQNFVSVGERNQAWIDGGMFSMSLIYALHAVGLGTCCLNWSKTYQTDLALRKAIGIPNSDVIIMMVAVGNLPEKFHVAISKRKSVDEVMFTDWHNKLGN